MQINFSIKFFWNQLYYTTLFLAIFKKAAKIMYTSARSDQTPPVTTENPLNDVDSSASISRKFIRNLNKLNFSRVWDAYRSSVIPILLKLSNLHNPDKSFSLIRLNTFILCPMQHTSIRYERQLLRIRERKTEQKKDKSGNNNNAHMQKTSTPSFPFPFRFQCALLFLFFSFSRPFLPLFFFSIFLPSAEFIREKGL